VAVLGLRTRLWRGLAAGCVAAGVYLVLSGGDQTLARGLLWAGLLYGVLTLIADRRERR
jgi:drug/metabolite transporter (DMT)-like permease